MQICYVALEVAERYQHNINDNDSRTLDVQLLSHRVYVLWYQFHWQQMMEKVKANIGPLPIIANQNIILAHITWGALNDAMDIFLKIVI